LKSILLIEDSRLVRRATEKVLLRAGYGVVTASDGQEALQIAFATSPDLIVLDMLLPKLSGPEVLRALRKHPVTQETPIIVLSGLSQANEKKLKEDGADAYLRKSCLELDSGGDSIVKMVESILTKFEQRSRNGISHN
jgi:CheY-like chemotaxis protein